jgi:hypothetical protein
MEITGGPLVEHTSVLASLFPLDAGLVTHAPLTQFMMYSPTVEGRL